MRPLLTAFFLLATASHATTLFSAFSQATLSGHPSDTLHFSGTLTNSTNSTVFVNGDNFTFAIVGAADDSPFFANAPLSVNPNSSVVPFVFINVTIPQGQSPATYDGTFTAIGGADSSAQDNLGTAAFHVQVTAAQVPEPGSMLLAGAGIAALGWRRRNRCSKSAPSMPISFRLKPRWAGLASASAVHGPPV